MSAVLNRPKSDLTAPRGRPTATSFLALVIVVLVGVGATAACSSSKKASPNSGSSGSPGTSQADKTLQEGLAAQNSGDLETARKKYLQVIQEDPTNKFAHFDLGVIYQQ